MPDQKLEAKPYFCIDECISNFIYLAGYFSGDLHEREWRIVSPSQPIGLFMALKLTLWTFCDFIFVSDTTNF